MSWFDTSSAAPSSLGSPFGFHLVAGVPSVEQDSTSRLSTTAMRDPVFSSRSPYLDHSPVLGCEREREHVAPLVVFIPN